MSQLKKDKWMLPSFDLTPSKESIKLKRFNSATLNTQEISGKRSNFRRFSSGTFIQGENVNSLSDLLNACLPKCSAELAVSKQKQQEISSWLRERHQKGEPRILLLSGPPGCGKTITFKVLAKEHCFDIIEWITPLDQVMDENNWIMRQGDRFEEFLIRATRYNSVLNCGIRRILLIKELPNVFVEDKKGFCDVLEKYIQFGREPLVFIHSETGSSRLMQTLFSTTIRENYRIDVINVNATTQVAMKKTLERVAKILNAKASHFLNVTQEKINEVLSNSIGDVRSAILNLIFTSLIVSECLEESGCNSRGESLSLLHGVGRIINPKRIAEGKFWKFVHNPDDIAAFFESQAGTLINFLHENYLKTLRDIDRVQISADILSLADILISEWRDPNLNKVALSFCIRGLMVTNDDPVNGWNPIKKPQNTTDTVDRNLANTEVRWYNSLIKPDSKIRNDMESKDNYVDEETMIEDD